MEAAQNSWLPERFSIVLAGKLISGEPDDVPDWIEQVKAAIATKAAEVRIGGVDVPTNSPGLLAALQRLRPAEAQPTDADDDKPSKTDETPKRRIHILQTKSNFDSSEFKRQMKVRQLRPYRP